MHATTTAGGEQAAWAPLAAGTARPAKRRQAQPARQQPDSSQAAARQQPDSRQTAARHPLDFAAPVTRVHAAALPRRHAAGLRLHVIVRQLHWGHVLATCARQAPAAVRSAVGRGCQAGGGVVVGPRPTRTQEQLHAPLAARARATSRAPYPARSSHRCASTSPSPASKWGPSSLAPPCTSCTARMAGRGLTSHQMAGRGVTTGRARPGSVAAADACAPCAAGQALARSGRCLPVRVVTLGVVLVRHDILLHLQRGAPPPLAVSGSRASGRVAPAALQCLADA